MGKLFRKISLAFIFIFLIWISFFCEYMQIIYQNVVLWVLFFLFILLLFKEDFWIGLNNWINISFLACILFFFISILKAVNQDIAFKCYFLPVAFLFLYFIFKLINFKSIKSKISITITILSTIVFIGGLLEILFHKNILYESIFPNPFYKTYLMQGKMMSTQWHPAILATYFLACLPFAIYCAENKKIKFKVLGILGIVSSIVGIILSRTHFPFIAMFVVLGIYAFQGRKKIFKLFFCLLILFLLLSVVLSHFNIVFRDFSILSKIHLYSLKYRLDRTIISLRIWKDYPITGVGFGNFRYLFDRYSGGVCSDYIHKIPDNMYLSLLTETGILGLSSFLFFIILVIIDGNRNLKIIQDKNDKKFLKLMVCGFIALLINMMGYDFLYWRMPLYFFCMYIGIINSLR